MQRDPLRRSRAGEGDSAAAHEAYQKAINQADDDDLLQHACLGGTALRGESKDYEKEAGLLEIQ